MNVLAAFCFAASLAVGISSLAVLALHRPLGALLLELCGSPGRARFWSVFTVVTILLAALFGMLVSFPLLDAHEWAGYPFVATAFSAVRTSVFFLLLGLGTLGLALMLGIGTNEERRHQEAMRSAKVAG